MRRRAPRPLAAALAEVTEAAAPAGLLTRVQACWEDVAGKVVAAEAQPVAEQGGTLTVRCASAVWAQELELLSPDLLERLNARLAASGGRPNGGVITRLRFSTGPPPGSAS